MSFSENWEVDTQNFFTTNIVRDTDYLDLGGWIGIKVIIIDEDIYGITPRANIPILPSAPPENAKTKMIRVHLKENRTIHHDTVGRFGAGKVILRAASPGTGIIAGGPMRALFESLGIKDVVAKSTGTSNPHNMLKATLNAFKMSESPKSVAAKRSKKINEINNNKND